MSGLAKDIQDGIALQRQILAALHDNGPLHLRAWGGKMVPLGTVFDQHAAILHCLEDQARRRGLL